MGFISKLHFLNCCPPHKNGYLMVSGDCWCCIHANFLYIICKIKLSLFLKLCIKLFSAIGSTEQKMLICIVLPILIYFLGILASIKSLLLSAFIALICGATIAWWMISLPTPFSFKQETVVRRWSFNCFSETSVPVPVYQCFLFDDCVQQRSLPL